MPEPGEIRLMQLHEDSIPLSLADQDTHHLPVSDEVSKQQLKERKVDIDHIYSRLKEIETKSSNGFSTSNQFSPAVFSTLQQSPKQLKQMRKGIHFSSIPITSTILSNSSVSASISHPRSSHFRSQIDFGGSDDDPTQLHQIKSQTSSIIPMTKSSIVTEKHILSQSESKNTSPSVESKPKYQEKSTDFSSNSSQYSDHSSDHDQFSSSKFSQQVPHSHLPNPSLETQEIGDVALDSHVERAVERILQKYGLIHGKLGDIQFSTSSSHVSLAESEAIKREKEEKEKKERERKRKEEEEERERKKREEEEKKKEGEKKRKEDEERRERERKRKEEEERERRRRRREEEEEERSRKER
ncbi:hypothetical protein ADUPG1_006593, partial [Aduncisulcus paluster]